MPIRLFQRYINKNNIPGLCLAMLCLLLSNCKEKEANVDEALFVKYHDKAVLLRSTGNNKKAIAFVDSFHQANKNFPLTKRWEKHNFKANIYLNRSINLKQAKLTIDSMYAILDGKEKLHPKLFIFTKFYEGDLLLKGENYNAGLKKYYEGENFAKSHLSPCELNDFTYKIALVKYKQKRYLEAIPYLKKTLSELATCNNADYNTRIFHPQTTLNTLGLCFERANLLDSAVIYYQKGIALINERKVEFPKSDKRSSTALAVIYGNLGGTYAQLGEDILAESLLLECIKINHKPSFALEDAHTAELKLVTLYIKNNRLSEAKTLLNKVEAELKEWELPLNANQQQLLLRLRELNWLLLDKANNIPEAYRAFRIFSQLKDSVFNAEKKVNEKDLESVFKIAKNEYELELLNKSNKLTTIYMWCAIISATFLFAILFLIFAYLTRYKRHNLVLKELNQKVGKKNIQLEEALTELQKSHEENSRIMKIIYHDLRSPIGGMTMAIDLMLEDLHHTDEDREMLQMINTSGQDAIGLINDMLQINTDVELTKENIKVDELLQYCNTMLQFKAEEKGQIITTQSDKIEILIDQEKIRRVINNLLSNAIKFSPFQSNIILDAKVQGNYILISCEDFGIGIPDDKLETIFEMFTEAKRVGTMGEVTFGMGLAICRQIVTAHHGQIWAENKEHGGSIFKILLPIAHH